MGGAVIGALLLVQAAGTAGDPAGESLSPWMVLPGEDMPGKRGRIALDGHQIFNQRAAPARVVRTAAPLTFDGVTLPAGSTLAVAMNVARQTLAWCVLPVPGGTAPGFRSPWGKGDTRCFADTDGDGRLDSGYVGKFDLLGLPSVRTIRQPVALAETLAFTAADPNSVEGFHVKATIFYFDEGKRKAWATCQSLLPDQLKKSAADPAKRRLAIALTRDDGTACYGPGTGTFREGTSYLPFKPGAVIGHWGVALRIDSITPEAVELTMLRGFTPYLIASRSYTKWVRR